MSCACRPGGTCGSSGDKTDTIDQSSEENRQKAKSATEDILAKKTTVLTVVENLRFQLTNPTINERVTANTILTEILLALPCDFLNTDEINALLSFFLARLQDSVLLLPNTLKSLRYLLRCKNAAAGAERTAFTAIFREVHVQSGTQDDRYMIYEIMDYCLKQKLDEMKLMETEFVLGFIQSIDGEKDPRCLALIFDLFQRITKEFPLGPFVDEMFDVIACYFPIQFKPPSDDFGITAEQLSGNLLRCLTSSAMFATLCIQKIHEQLREDSLDSKTEALLLMDEALVQFPSGSFAEDANALWEELRKQILVPKSGRLETMALRCLSGLTRTLCANKDKNGNNSHLVVFLGQLFRDCEPFLANPEMQLLEPTHNIITTVAKVDSSIATRMADNVLALLMEKYQNHRMAKNQYASMLLDWCSLLAVQAPGALFNVRTSLTCLVIDDMLQKTEAIDGALRIAAALLDVRDDATTGAFLTDDQCQAIANVAVQEINRLEDPESSRLYLRSLAKRRWETVKQQILPLLESTISEQHRMRNTLAYLVVDQRSSNEIINRLLAPSNTRSDKSLMNTVKAMEMLFKLNSNGGQSNTARVSADLISEENYFKICDYIRIAAHDLAAQTSGVSSSVEQDTIEGSSIEQIADMAQDIILYCSESVQPFVINRLLQGFDLETLSNTKSVALLVYLDRILAVVSVNECQQLKTSVGRFFQSECKSKEPVENFYLSRIYASVVNRLPSDDEAVKDTLETILSNIDDGKKVSARNLELYAWLCKSLLLRNWQPYADRLLAAIIRHLSSNDKSSSDAAVDVLTVVLDANPDARLLSSRTRANITWLSQQRIFCCSAALLTKEFSSSKQSDDKSNYFRALSLTLAYMPKTAQCDAEVEKLLPLLLNAVESDDAVVLASTVNCFGQLLSNALTKAILEQLHPHLRSLSERFVALAKLQKSDMKLRISALDCVIAITDKFPAIILHPWRLIILKELYPCLDDRKRIVRGKAVIARNKWFLLK